MNLGFIVNIFSIANCVTDWFVVIKNQNKEWEFKISECFVIQNQNLDLDIIKFSKSKGHVDR